MQDVIERFAYVKIIDFWDKFNAVLNVCIYREIDKNSFVAGAFFI